MSALSARRYSERLGVIDPEQLQRACDQFDLGVVTAAEPASAGLWGQNILLSTTTGEFVLRGNPYSSEQLPKERLVAETVDGRSQLRVPWPYRISDDAELFGWAFAVMPRLTGTRGSTLWAAADADRRVELAAAHGKALAELHQVTFAAPGPYDASRDRFAEVDRFQVWTLDRIESLRMRCRAIDAFSPEADLYVDRLVDECAAALAGSFVPVLVHHDFSLANTNYELLDDRYHAVGVFDLGEAHVGDGEEDLVRFLFRRKREQREAFVATYAERRPFRPGGGDRLALYALADLLFLWEVSKRNTDWFGDATFVETATPVIDRARMAVV